MSYSPSYNAVQRARRSLARASLLAALKPCDFTIISNDCWGGEIYRRLKIPYRTPFVGLYLMTPCYLRLLQDLRGLLEQPLKWLEHSRYDSVNAEKVRLGNYPSALLGGEVEIHFMHYHSPAEAAEKWQRRIRRMNWNNLAVKMDYGKDLATAEHLQAFEALKLGKRLALGAQFHPEFSHAVAVQNYTAQGADMLRVAAQEMDLVRWLKTGEIHRFDPAGFSFRRSLHNRLWQWL